MAIAGVTALFVLSLLKPEVWKQSYILGLMLVPWDKLFSEGGKTIEEVAEGIQKMRRASKKRKEVAALEQLANPSSIILKP
jgi:hypothetical protein